MNAQLLQQETRRRDLRQYERRVRIRVVARPLSQVVEGTVVPGGANVPYELLIAESSLPRVQALVETEEQRANIALAKQMHERKFAAWARASGLSLDRPELRKRAEEAYFGSVEAEYHTIAGEGLPPLLSCEVVERGIEPDLSDDDRRESGIVEKILARLFAAAQGSAVVQAAPVASSGSSSIFDAAPAPAETPKRKG